VDERKGILFSSILVMTAISIVVAAVIISCLFEATFEGQRRRLAEIAQSQARLLEAIAATVPSPEVAVQIMQVAHRNFGGVGVSGEFSLARRDGEMIQFLLHRRHVTLIDLQAAPFAAMQDKPIGRALLGQSGTMIGIDYRGEPVLAAYEPVTALRWGIVAKIDLSEIRAPFVTAGMTAGGGAVVVILVGVLVCLRISTPLIRRLRESEASTQAILDTAPDGIITFNAGGAIHSLNRAAEQLFDCAAHEVIGRPVSRLLPSLSLDDCSNNSAFDLGRRGPVHLGIVHEAIGQRRDGTTFPVDMTMSQTQVGERQLFIGIVRDITLRKRLESQLRQLQKMEAIGTLVGGIAHDFNNILAAILGYAELALSKVSQRSPARRYLQEVLKAARRAKDLVQQILAFSRHTEVERRPVQLLPLVREALSLLRASLPSTIEMRHFLDPGVGSVLADPTQMHQILMNLGANAEYAMRQTGGILDIRLEAVELDTVAAAAHPKLKPGSYVRLTVRDTGHGMPPEVMERIFEPFFTTKGVGEGTGMGLAVVHGIVTSYEGAITVDSAPGQGTTFTIYLPRLQEGVAEGLAAPEPIPRGQGCILFVDDEADLVRLGREMLEPLGYQVVTQTSSHEALETFRAAPQQFDLVITDQTMPKMTGAMLAQELRRIRPDVPIILCTGFSHSIDAEKAKELGIDAFLTKPIEVYEWAVAIRRLLEQRNA
jgi:PAS domain S-box-containing protein